MKRAFARFRTDERSSDRRLQDFKRIELARLGAGSLGTSPAGIANRRLLPFHKLPVARLGDETALTGVCPMKVAILDDYQNVALQLADWSAVARHVCG